MCIRDRYGDTPGESVYTALDSPDHLLVMAAGGPAGFGAIIPPLDEPQDQGGDRGDRRVRGL